MKCYQDCGADFETDLKLRLIPAVDGLLRHSITAAVEDSIQLLDAKIDKGDNVFWLSVYIFKPTQKAGYMTLIRFEKKQKQWSYSIKQFNRQIPDGSIYPLSIGLWCVLPSPHRDGVHGKFVELSSRTQDMYYLGNASCTATSFILLIPL